MARVDKTSFATFRARRRGSVAGWVSRTALLVGALALGSVALATSPVWAQMSESDLIVRLNQLESQMRRLTGDIEQLQYRNQQLEQQLKRMGEDYEFRFQELGKGGGGAAPGRRSEASPPPSGATPPTMAQSAEPSPAAPSGRRSDAFDPSRRPDAPGTPRVLGSIQGESTPAPGQQQPGAPLDLSAMAAAAAAESSPGSAYGGSSYGTASAGGLPPPPPSNPSGTGARYATLPPSASPRDEYDLGYGYVLRKDYALAEQTLREFLRKHPNDALADNAQFWLGESLYQRRSYRDAADAFLAVSQKHPNSEKAPDALLRLGQSLAAMQQKDLACSSFAEVERKYPKASANVKRAVDREQKRVGC